MSVTIKSKHPLDLNPSPGIFHLLLDGFDFGFRYAFTEELRGAFNEHLVPARHGPGTASSVLRTRYGLEAARPGGSIMNDRRVRARGLH